MALSNLTEPRKGATFEFDWTGNDRGGVARSIPCKLVVDINFEVRKRAVLVVNHSTPQEKAFTFDYELEAVPVAGGSPEQVAARTRMAAFLNAALPVLTGVE